MLLLDLGGSGKVTWCYAAVGTLCKHRNTVLGIVQARTLST